MKIGVLSESFRLPMLQAVDQAAALELDGLHRKRAAPPY